MTIAKRKTKKKSKLKTLPQLHNYAAELLQKLVRLKASDDNGYCSCVTCGITKRWNDGMQGGHFISRGKAPTKLMEENIHPQCAGCNKFGMQFRDVEKVYTLYMIDMYGRDEVDAMIVQSGAVHKWVRSDLDDFIVDMKQQIKYQEDKIS